MKPRQRVFRLTNQARQANRVRSLRRSPLLDRSAQAKARLLARTGTLAHGRWWVLINRIAGRRYGAIGENIATRQDDPAQVVRQWLDSPEHRRNMLGAQFTHLGVGLVRRGDVEYWVQHFGGRR